jgi:hypothetical protein
MHSQIVRGIRAGVAQQTDHCPRWGEAARDAQPLDSSIVHPLRVEAGKHMPIQQSIQARLFSHQ